MQARIFEGSIILPFNILNGPGGVLDPDGCARAVQHIDRADFFDAPIIEPKLAGLCTPHAGVETHLRGIQRIEIEADLAPIGRGWQPKLAWRQFPVSRQDEHFKRVGWLQSFGFHPERYPVSAMRLQLHRLHNAAMAVLIGSEILEPQGGLAAVLHLRIEKPDYAGLLVKIEALELVAIVFLESTVLPRNRSRNEPRFAIGDCERRIQNRQTLRQIPVMRQDATAVANGKEGRDEFEMVRLADALNGGQTPEIIR